MPPPVTQYKVVHVTNTQNLETILNDPAMAAWTLVEVILNQVTGNDRLCVIWKK